MSFKQILKQMAQNKNPHVPWSEHFRSAIGGIVGGGFVAFIAKFASEYTEINEWAMASLGASALLVFVLPSSPMAQPKAVIGGNIVSALVGVTCAILIPDPRLGMPIAIGVSILGMLFFKCLHAPAAATALSAILGHIVTYRFALFPVLMDSLLLVLAGIFYNRITGKQYPHTEKSPGNISSKSPSAETMSLIEDKNAIAQVLAKYKEFIDINPGDLANIIRDVELHAYQQKLKSITCSAIMSSPVISVEMATPLEEAWIRIRKNHIKSLPVVDRNDRIVGIITLEHFLKYAAVDFDKTFGQRLQGFMRQSFSRASVKLSDAYPNAVGQVMQKTVRVISTNRNLLDLVTIFEGDGHHHLPVIDEHQKLAGMITQSDFVRAIHSSME
ncbi:HPP family protein [Polynucleobacter sphagniphilus]|uniref:HPP family protein n=2 Tax=Polynucleobacter TaxID=44013 RepID=UPI002407561E|nr:HPP family protein [Polynucleobacter sphagniphilus]MDF9787138.1 CBS domain-containing membrane protein [Polynucleobacter sphagniphilus]